MADAGTGVPDQSVPGRAFSAPRDGFKSLDLIRAISAQIVVIGHTFSLIIRPGPIQGGLLTWVGWRVLSLPSGHGTDAVSVFFVLSGLLVGSPLPQMIRRGDFNYGDYTIRRLSRMYAVLLPALALSALLVSTAFAVGSGADVITVNTPFYPPDWSVSRSMSAPTAVCNALFLQTVVCPQFMHNSALWSLSNEMMYYLAFPAILLIAFRRGSLRVRILATAILLGLGGIWFYAESIEATRGVQFAVGLLMWIGGAGIPEFRARLTSRGLAVMSIVCALAGLAMYMTHREAIRMPAVALLTIALLVHVQELEATVHRWTRISTVGHWASNCSFSLYAIHIPLLFTAVSFSPFLLGKIPRTTVNLGWTLAILVGVNLVAFAFYAVFERRYRALYVLMRSQLARLFHVQAS
ncbi:MAG: acyltransferase [Vicinamibacterales bacterium]